jgi:hypothetical protein
MFLIIRVPFSGTLYAHPINVLVFMHIRNHANVIYVP